MQGSISLGRVLGAELHLGSWKHSSKASEKVFDVVLVLKKSSTAFFHKNYKCTVFTVKTYWLGLMLFGDLKAAMHCMIFVVNPYTVF